MARGKPARLSLSPVRQTFREVPAARRSSETQPSIMMCQTMRALLDHRSGKLRGLDMARKPFAGAQMCRHENVRYPVNCHLGRILFRKQRPGHKGIPGCNDAQVIECRSQNRHFETTKYSELAAYVGDEQGCCGRVVFARDAKMNR